MIHVHSCPSNCKLRPGAYMDVPMNRYNDHGHDCQIRLNNYTEIEVCLRNAEHYRLCCLTAVDIATQLCGLKIDDIAPSACPSAQLAANSRSKFAFLSCTMSTSQVLYSSQDQLCSLQR